MHKQRLNRLCKVLCCSYALLLVASAKDQSLYIKTKQAGFKFMQGSGSIEIECTGSILLSGFKGKILSSNNFQKDYCDKTRTVFNGKGKFILTGTFNAIQCLGKNIFAKWTGKGSAKLFEEHEPQNMFGTYWFSNSPKIFTWPKTPFYIIKLPHNDKNK